jgi:hypothetical protein
MLDFFAKAKNIELSSGRTVTIVRAGLGYFFRLTEAVLMLKDVEVKQADNDIKKYLEWAIQHPQELARYTLYLNEVFRYLKHFVIDWDDKFTNEEKVEILKEVQKHNSYGSGGGKPIQSVKQLNESLNSTISFLVAYAHYDIEYIGKELDIVQASILAGHFNSLRVSQINDMAISIVSAIGGKDTKKTVNKYLAALQGKKSGTFEDAIREMAEAEAVKSELKAGKDG